MSVTAENNVKRKSALSVEREVGEIKIFLIGMMGAGKSLLG